MRGTVVLGILGLGLVLMAQCAGGAEELLRTAFGDSAAGWTGVDRATVAEVSRRTGGKSLCIEQWEDDQQDSHWLSPPIGSPGGAVKISFWAADDYLKQPDFSYAAVVDVVDQDAAGKELGTTWYLRSIPWDDSRKTGMWGQLLPEGRVWKYYEAVHRPRGEAFRLKFHWRKPIVRGACYLTDLVVTQATPEDVAAAAPTTAGNAEGPANRYALEISTPVLGNLFYHDDPLRFEALLFTTDDADIGPLETPLLRYEITDFGHFRIAAGEISFDGAKPVSDPAFYTSNPGRARKHNLHRAVLVTAPEAAGVGRELFFQAKLISNGVALASDTVTYGVVNPRKIDPADYEKCHFASSYFGQGFTFTDSKHEAQTVAVKTGIAWNQVYDYGWKRVQPTYPGPYNFGAKQPPFPRITYCPNTEQERVQEKWIRDQVPPECVIPDPLRPGKVTFKIDPYVEYIVAYIRHNRDAIARVVPSGLERAIDARTIELHKKAYAAIKAEWPELPVGFMPYGLPMNPSTDVDMILDTKLYETIDFFDTHAYASSFDWTEWERLKAGLRKVGHAVPPLHSTEFCRVGGMDQVQRSRDMVGAHLDAFAHGMTHLYYFNCCNETNFLRHPFLREPTDLGGTQTSGFMYMQRVDRPRVSEAIRPANPAQRWALGSWGWEYGAHTMMPVLQAMTYYNLVQNFETAAFRAVVEPSPNAVGYIFDRGDRTICALWLRRPVPPEAIVIRGDTGYTVQDLFGRTERITPSGGVSLLSVDPNPITLVFDRRVPLVDAKQGVNDLAAVEGGIALQPVARGTTGTATVTVPAIFAQGTRLAVTCTVDGVWPKVQRAELAAGPDAPSSARVAVPVPLERPTGTHPLTARLHLDGALVGLLKTPLEVRELLDIAIVGVPPTGPIPPAVRVTVHSLQDKPSQGTVRLRNVFFSDGERCVPLEKPYSLLARGSAGVVFPVPPEQVSLTTTYEVCAEVADTSGIALSRTEEIAFRATPRAAGKMAVDGDLADWNLEEQPAIPFERRFTVWGKPWGGPDDLSGRFYTMWDEGFLYFAAVVTDDSHVARHNDVGLWTDDNFMLGLYPWGWRMGETLNSGYYREHLGLCKDGQARIFRVGNVEVGPPTAAGAQIAVKRTETGYIYEWAYPKACIAPLQLEPDSRFRLSLFLMDTDETGDPQNPFSRLGGIQFAGFNENVDARPVKWREFVLTE